MRSGFIRLATRNVVGYAGYDPLHNPWCQLSDTMNWNRTFAVSLQDSWHLPRSPVGRVRVGVLRQVEGVPQDWTDHPAAVLPRARQAAF